MIDREFLGANLDPFTSPVLRGSLLLNYFLSIPYFIILLLLEYSTDGGSGGYLGKALRWVRECLNQQQLKNLGIMKELKDESRKAANEANNMRSVLDKDDVRERDFVENDKQELKHKASILLSDVWKVCPMKNALLSFLPSQFGVMSLAASNVKSDATSVAHNAVRSSVAKASEKLPDKEHVKTKVDNAVSSSKKFADYVQSEDIKIDMKNKANQSMKDVADFMSQDDAISIASSMLREKVTDLSNAIRKSAIIAAKNFDQQLLTGPGPYPNFSSGVVNGNRTCSTRSTSSPSQDATFGGATPAAAQEQNNNTAVPTEVESIPERRKNIIQSGSSGVRKYFDDIAERGRQQHEHDGPEEHAKIAVRGLHTAIPPGEIFGLLGVVSTFIISRFLM